MLKRLIIKILLLTFSFSSLGPLPEAFAQPVLNLPVPGQMMTNSKSFKPLELKGIQIYPKNPMRFDFLVDQGDSKAKGGVLKDEITQLSKYFLTCLTVPEKDLWVNLSPYERDRIAANDFGVTEMGKALLEQDYLLKQMMASLSYPENELGKKFWERVYRKVGELYGTTDIPMNSFNKVWIVPKTAEVFVRNNGAFVVNSQLDVMLEVDYKAATRQLQKDYPGKDQTSTSAMNERVAQLYSQMVREVILPELRREVNEGSHFAVVRQVYSAMILATWYKRHLKNSILGKVYVGQNKVQGIDVEDKDIKEKIFQQYLQAYKKTVYNYIREDVDPTTQETITRKYTSGGMDFAMFGIEGNRVYKELATTQGMILGSDLAMASIDLKATNEEGQLLTFPVAASDRSDVAMLSRKIALSMFILPVMFGFSGILGQSAQAQVPTALPSVSTIQVTQLSGPVETFLQKKAWQLAGKVVQEGFDEPKIIKQENTSGTYNVYSSWELSEQEAQVVWQKFVYTQYIAEMSARAGDVQKEVTVKENTVGGIRKQISDVKDQENIIWKVSKSLDGKVASDLTPKMVEDVDKEAHQLEKTKEWAFKGYKKTPYNKGKAYFDEPTVILSAKAENDPNPYKAHVLSPRVLDTDEANKFWKQFLYQELRYGLNRQIGTLQESLVGASAEIAPLKEQYRKINQEINQAKTGLKGLEGTAIVKKSLVVEPVIQTDPSPASAGGSEPPPPPDGDDEGSLGSADKGFNTRAFGIPSPSAALTGVAPLIPGTSPVAAFPAVTIPMLPSQTLLGNTSQLEREAEQQANGEEAGLINRLFTLDNIPSVEQITSSEWFPWLIGTAIAGGAAALLALAGLGRKKGKKDEKVQQNFLVEPLKAPLAPNVQSPIHVPTSPVFVREAPDALLPPSPDELRAAAVGQGFTLDLDLQRELEKKALRNPRANRNALGWMDPLTAITGMSLAFLAFGLEPISLVTTAIVLPFLRRMSLFVQVVPVHEVLGHARKAKGLYKNKVAAYTWANLTGNLSTGQLIKYLIPGLEPNGDPYIQLPVSNARIQKAGITTTIWMGLLSTVGIAVAAYTHTWLLPLLAPWGTSFIQVLKGSLNSDTKPLSKNADGQYKYFCAIGGGFTWGTIKQLAEQGNATMFNWLAKVANNYQRRGILSSGVYYQGPDGEGGVDTQLVKADKAKHGSGSDVVGNIFGKLTKSVKPIRVFESTDDEYLMSTAVFHTRWPTWLPPSPGSPHPHTGKNEGDTKFQFVTATDPAGRKFRKLDVSNEEDVVDVDDIAETIIGHNGDNKLHKFTLNGHTYEMGVGEMRELFSQLTHLEGQLPSGDSPPIALQILFYLTQGKWSSAARFAHVMLHHETLDEVRADVLTKEEKKAVGDIFKRVYLKFAQRLARPDLKDLNKTFKDLYVAEDIGDQHPVLHNQYLLLQEFEKALLGEFLAEVTLSQNGRGSLPARILQHWYTPGSSNQVNEALIQKFISVTVERFFTGDLKQAVKDFRFASSGTYGKFIVSPVGEYANQLHLASCKQDVIFAFNKKTRKFAFGSHPAALQMPDENGDQLDTFVYLKGKGEGEIANIQVNRITGEFEYEIYLVDEKRYLAPEEKIQRAFKLVEGSPYHLPMPQYADERRKPVEELQALPQALARGEQQWRDEESFIRQSAENVLRRAIEIELEDRIFQSVAYQKVYPEVHERMFIFAQLCGTAGSCTDDQLDFLTSEAANTSEKTSVLMRLFRQQLMDAIPELAASMKTEKWDKKELSQRITALIDAQKKEFLSFLIKDHLSEIAAQWKEEKKKLPATALTDKQKKVRMVITGYGGANHIAKAAANLYNQLIPGLGVEGVSANEFIDYPNLDFDITSLRMAVVTETTLNFPAKVDVATAQDVVGANNVWGFTTRVDNPMSVTDIGQSLWYDPDTGEHAPFEGRVFPYANDYTSEAPVLTEALLEFHLLKSAVFVAQGLKDAFPDQTPLNVRLTDADENWINDHLYESLIEDASNITGHDELGNPVTSEVIQHQDGENGPIKAKVSDLIDERSELLKGRYKETSITSRGWFWTYVIGTSMAGMGIVGASLWALHQGFLKGIEALKGVIASDNEGLATGAKVLQDSMGWGEQVTRWLLAPENHYVLGFLEPVATLIGGLWLAPVLYRWFYLRWKAWDRMGPPPLVTFLGLKETAPRKKFFVNVMRSRSFASMSSPTEDGNYMDTALPELYGIASNRGSLLDFHVPPVSLPARDNLESTVRQLLVSRTGSLLTGTALESGAHSFTTSREVVDDSKLPEGSALLEIGLSHNNIVLGGSHHIPGKDLSPAIHFLYAQVDEMGGLMAQKAIWAKMYDRLTSKGKLWDYSTTYSQAMDHSTQTPQAALEELPSQMRDRAQISIMPNSLVVDVQSPQRKGGIDMDSRLMKLDVKGNDTVVMEESAREAFMVSVKGITPTVFQIVPVTPSMLQSILAEVR